MKNLNGKRVKSTLHGTFKVKCFLYYNNFRYKMTTSGKINCNVKKNIVR